MTDVVNLENSGGDSAEVHLYGKKIQNIIYRNSTYCSIVCIFLSIDFNINHICVQAPVTKY